MSKCLICENEITPFISFGKMPIANGFLTREQFNDEYYCELKVAHCTKCHMVQLTELVDKERMFNDNYAFFASTSRYMSEHFKILANDITNNFLSSKPFVVEIGSNDGIMLQNFAAKSIPHLGVEPSKNVADVSIQKGINTICSFFNLETANLIMNDYGQADVIVGTNVMCHIPYIHSVLEGVSELLKPSGVLIFEDPYMGDIIRRTSFDQIYDEHAFYFSATSVRYLTHLYNMELIDVIPTTTHGGSMRYIIARKGARTISQSVSDQIKYEEKIGLHKSETYDVLASNIAKIKAELLALLNRLIKDGKRIVGYGATSKSTTVTNYCGITPEHVEFISDTTPIKQSKYSPGAHIPVKDYNAFVSNYPDYALLFAWNHAKEIMEKEKGFIQSGGKFIVYVDKVGIVESYE